MTQRAVAAAVAICIFLMKLYRAVRRQTHNCYVFATGSLQHVRADARLILEMSMTFGGLYRGVGGVSEAYVSLGARYRKPPVCPGGCKVNLGDAKDVGNIGAFGE